MKKILILFTIITTFGLKGQTTIINMVDRCNNSYDRTTGNVYLKDNSSIFTPYIGTWKWTDGNKEMILTLIKQTKYHYTQGIYNYFADRLVGYYVYKENGVIITNTSNDNLMKDFGLNVEFDMSCDMHIGTSFFKDVNKNKTYEVWVELLSATKMNFRGKMGESSIIVPKTGTVTVQGGTTFPLHMTFIKQ